jgi:hypothetical protein
MMNWPPYPPDMNPIENRWSMWEMLLRNIFSDLSRIPHRMEEIIRLAQQVREDLPWSKIY